MSTLSSIDSAPSSSPGRMWEWMSITRSPSALMRSLTLPLGRPSDRENAPTHCEKSAGESRYAWGTIGPHEALRDRGAAGDLANERNEQQPGAGAGRADVYRPEGQ